MDDLFGKMQELMSDPESMKQLSELAQMLGQEGDSSGAAAECTGENAGGGFPFDPGMLMQLGSLIQGANTSNANTELLLALKPHLRQQRQEKVDRAVKMLRLLAIWNLMKENGLLQNFLS